MLYNETLLRERCKFLVKSRFYRVVPNHLNYITKNINKNHMFLKSGKIKQNKIIEYVKSKILNIEIIDLHTQIFNNKQVLENITSDLEKLVGRNLTTLFIDYYMTKLTFIMEKIKLKLENKLNA